jgi:hypothetical protein
VREISKVLIIAENKNANKNKILNIEWDGLILKNAGIPIPETNPQQWYFTMYDKHLPEKMISEGRHKIKVSFVGQKFSEEMDIIISKKAPFERKGLDEIVSDIRNSEIKVVEVDNVIDLIKSIKPNTKIILTPGKYNLSKGTKVENKYISWNENYDGLEPTIKGVQNFTIQGKGSVEIVIEPRYAFVLNFEECKNINLSNLTIGHVKKGFCLGGVLGFLNVDDIILDNLDLYGSGSVGIQANGVNYLKMTNSIIRDCSYYLLNLKKVSNVKFTESKFLNTGEFSLVNIYNPASNVIFDYCSFIDNWSVEGMFGDYLFTVQENCSNIEVKNSLFRGNKIPHFSNSDVLKVTNCKFDNNSFDKIN